jgi:hypothetical protein
VITPPQGDATDIVFSALQEDTLSVSMTRSATISDDQPMRAILHLG